MPRRSALIFFLLFLLLLVIAGCALVKPTRVTEVSTQVDAGLPGAYLGSAAVVPFHAAGDESWGTYASRKLADYLMENRAFGQVTVAQGAVPDTNYVVDGTLEHLFYGGNEGPTTVFLTIRVVSTSDSRVRFQRSVKASSEKSAFHLAWLRRVDVRSPYIEEVMNSALKAVANDIASRTHSPAVQNP